MNKSTELAIKATARFTGTLSKSHSRSWYAEHLQETLHPSLRSYNDVKAHCDNHYDDKVYGVYLRHEMNQLVRVKIGKGVVYFFNGRSICTRDHLSATENPLETEVFIPCASEEAALTLEDALHRYFGKLEGVHGSIESAYEIIDKRWLAPAINSEGSAGGTENFNFEDIWENRIDVFTNAVQTVTQQKNVNVINFAQIARANSQVKGSDLLALWLVNGNDMRDFFLLMKPRAGKNTTMFFGIAKYIKALRNAGIDKKIIIDFISLWPSAFEGAKKDLRDYYYIEGIVLAGVDTNDSDWKDKYKELSDDSKVDAIFRFASMQSIDMSLAEEYNTDENREGSEIVFESAKCEYFKNNPADLCVIDESDHGMRTTRSQQALDLFGYTRRIWMSGTDLYALRHEICTGNHFLYDIFDEIKDIKAGSIKMPRMRKHSLIAKILPLEDLDPVEMDEQEITRKLVALFHTTKVGNWTFDKITQRFVDEQGNKIQFTKFGEVNRLWDMIYYWENNKGIRAPEDHKHIFCCMPSVASCLALYNHIMDREIDCEHIPLTANTFSSASRIEQQVNDSMKGKRTIFLTVGRMLRGAKAPWSAVVRFDAYNDFKIGHQLELRGQNTTEDWFDVYDANIFRASVMQYELVRGRTKGGTINSSGKELHSLIPMTRKGEFDTIDTTWEDVQEDYFAGNVVEGMKRRNLLDRAGLVDAQELLSTVTKANTAIKEDKDEREGKIGSSQNGSTVKSKSEKDELEELIKKGMTISSMLPLLLEITAHQYTEINDLIDNVPDDLFNSWLADKCLDKKAERSYHTYDKELIKNLFVEELINEQLQIASKKMRHTDFDFSQFSNSNNADVNVPEWMADKDTKKLPNLESICDLSVGDGQLIVSFLKERTVNSITICDKSLINLKTAECRIKKAQQNCKIISILYTSIDDLTRKLYMKTNSKPNFNCVLTNPPFFGKGNPDHLQFLSLANELSDQYILFVQPSTYLVDQKKENSWYQDARNIIKDHLVNVTLYTKDVFDNAQLNTGVAAIIVDKKTTVTEYDVEYNNLNKTVHYTSIEDINNFASNDIFHSIKDKVLKACKIRNLQNDLESTGDYCVPLPKLQRYRFLPDRAEVVRSDEYADDYAAFYKTKELADAAFDYLKTPFAILALHIYKLDMNIASGKHPRSVPSFITVEDFKNAATVVGLTEEEQAWCKAIFDNSTDYIRFS